MVIPTLVIGLGGTGVKVVTLVKQNLLATHGGQVPPEVQLLAFDTERGSDVQAGVAMTTTSGGPATTVKLAEGEYILVGGSVRDYVRDVARGNYPHVGSWFQAAYYLDTLPDNLFFLEQGAGMLRQFGRLAIFHDIQKGEAQAKIHPSLQRAFDKVQKASGSKVVQVVLVSSVAGGTGAGMFIDIAHLTRQIAKLRFNIEIRLRGFLVMPEAFQTIPGGVTRDMHARAYAAMRENRRFMVMPDWGVSYPMYYTSSIGTLGIQDVWLGWVQSKLFDFLYYVDGRRDRNSLAMVPLELGVAPSIADMIAAILDEERGSKFGRHQANLNNVLNARGQTSERTAFYGAVGTFSFVLPIYHIIEGFAYRLAEDTLKTLLAPERMDKDGIPVNLAPDRNKEAGEGRAGQLDARAFLKWSEIVNVRDSEQRVQNSPLTMNGVASILDRYQPAEKDTLATELAGRTLQNWLEYYTPTGAEAASTRIRVEAILGQRIEAIVPPSNQVPRERPQDGVIRIEEGVAVYKAQHLGGEKEGGRREGGEYRTALEKYYAIHLERFRAMLDLHCANILNGASTEDLRLAKGGKLGYLLSFLDGLARELDTFLGLMGLARDVREGRQERASAIGGAQSALGEMKTQARAWPRGRATRAQEKYLEAEQDLINILRLEILELMAEKTLQAMREYTQGARDKVQTWINSLAIGKNSLYSAVLEGKQQALVSRMAEEKVPVRQFVPSVTKEEFRDPKYEDDLYMQYAQKRGDRLNELLRDLTWQPRTGKIGLNKVFDLGLTLTLHRGDQTEDKVLGADVRQENLRLILGRCREPFAEMWEAETALKYLRQKYTPDQLGKLLFDNGGPLLLWSVPSGCQVEPVTANYIRTQYGAAGDDAYLKAVTDDVAYRSSADPDRFAGIIQSADPFKLSLIYTQDLIPVEGMRSFIDAEDDYLRWRGTGVVSGRGRDILHIFPAEVNAVRLEERAFSELEYPQRVFDNKTAIQLENLDRFQLFVSCLALGVIQRHTDMDPDRGLAVSFYRLTLPEEALGPGQTLPAQEIRLTKPASGELSLLEALSTFTFIGEDVRLEILRPIDYDRVKRALTKVRSTHDLEAQVLMCKDLLQTEVLPLGKAEDAARRDLSMAMYLAVNDLIASIRAMPRLVIPRRFFELWDTLDVNDFYHRAQSFARHMCDLTGLSIRESAAENEQRVLISVESGQLFGDIPRFPRVIPFLFLRQARPLSLDDLEDIRRMLVEGVRPPSQIAILVVFGDAEALRETRSLLARVMRCVYAFDIIAPSHAELLEMVSSSNPKRLLRQMVLSQVNLAFVSPYVVTGPVPDNMFFGREPVLRAITEHAEVVSHALIGGRRVGKTSILHRLHRVRLPARGFRSLFHDCETTTTESAFLKTVTEAWLGSKAQTPPSFVDLVSQLPHDKPLIILLDEVDRLIPSDSVLDYPLFSTFRALAQMGHCQFVLAGERRLREAMADPCGPLFNFANEQIIGLLEFSATEELVTRPLKMLEVRMENQAQTVRCIYDLTSGHPNIVQRLCRRFVALLAERDDRYLTMEDVNAITADPEFLRYDFLDIYWERASVLEKLASLTMVKDKCVHTLAEVQEALSQEGVEVSLNELDGALERLVNFRNILKRTQTGYDFAVAAFPRIVSQSQRLGDLIALNRETYQVEGDIVVVEHHIPEEP